MIRVEIESKKKTLLEDLMIIEDSTDSKIFIHAGTGNGYLNVPKDKWEQFKALVASIK